MNVSLARQLESPLINAAGSINGTNPESILRECGALSQTAIAAITYGTITIPPRAGNEARYGAPVYFHDNQTGTTYNSMGFPNIGEAGAIALAPLIMERAHDQENPKPVIYSAAPTVESGYGTSVEQAVRLAYNFLETGVDFVELCVSCPNLVTKGGGRKPIMGYDLESMYDLAERLYQELGETGRLGIKLPPYLGSDEAIVPDLARILQAWRVFRFFVVCNSIPNQVPKNARGEPILTVPGGLGGMSGPATKEIGRAQLKLWRQHLSQDAYIISTLGIDSGAELARRIQLGAIAGGGVTFLWESRNWKTAITTMLEEFAAQSDEEQSVPENI